MQPAETTSFLHPEDGQNLDSASSNPTFEYRPGSQLAMERIAEVGNAALMEVGYPAALQARRLRDGIWHIVSPKDRDVDTTTELRMRAVALGGHGNARRRQAHALSHVCWQGVAEVHACPGRASRPVLPRRPVMNLHDWPDTPR